MVGLLNLYCIFLTVAIVGVTLLQERVQGGLVISDFNYSDVEITKLARTIIIINFLY